MCPVVQGPAGNHQVDAGGPASARPRTSLSGVSTKKTGLDLTGHRQTQTLGMGPGPPRATMPRHPPPALYNGDLALGGDARARADTKPRHPPPAFYNGDLVMGGDARACAGSRFC